MPKQTYSLTPEQLLLAQQLRAVRPPVVTGTNMVFDPKLRLAWYALVSHHAPKVGAQAALFFDECGIPD